ncbi:hypothetical protein [Streptomyces sp. NRRL S-87]|uniref:hypothetical protein n=1 Tax=Streptomyces sp. NRRL S-87 TaxID=1463920 RepID=UPI0004BFF3FC|nr:hypothetical protein [Streptomyces sp. NRRL S-87]
MNLRLVGISAGVLVALALPLAAATAGPLSDGSGGGLLTSLGLRGSAGGGGGDVERAAGSGHPGGPGGSARDADGRVPRHPGGAPAGRGDGGARGAAESGPDGAPVARTRCGPELSSPEGVEGQTCVLTDAGDTWGRTYYRNATGRPLDAVLTLMAPGGRTVQIRCAVAAGDEPGICETPREPSAGGPDDYSAVAEFSVPEEDGPLLLRAGSNSGAAPEG